MVAQRGKFGGRALLHHVLVFLLVDVRLPCSRAHSNENAGGKERDTKDSPTLSQAVGQRTPEFPPSCLMV